jgi:uncharacterized protein (TIGR02996 family)
MSDVAGLMHAIHDLPHDNLPRLALADWLEENGQADRAELIRLQIALASMARQDDRFRPLFERELALLKAHKDEWFGTFRSGWTWYECRCGFIEEVWAAAEHVLPHADWFLQHHALQQVRLKGTMQHLGSFLSSPLPGVLRAAQIAAEVHPASTHDLVPRTDPLARRPLHLAVGYLGPGNLLVPTLTAQPLPARLGSLDLSRNLIGAGNVGALLDALQHCPMLTRLDLSGGYHARNSRAGPRPNIGDAGIVHLAEHSLVARLEEINLACNQIGEEGARALVESAHLSGEAHLILGEDARQLPAAQRRALRSRFGAQLTGLSEGRNSG